MKRRTQAGFTLIEVMIAVAIIGILSAVALFAYQDYVGTANLAKVTTHYNEAQRYIVSEIHKRHGAVTMGAVDEYVAPTAAEIVADLNALGGRAPGGAPAYSVDAGDSTAASGVVLVTSADGVLRVTMPAYGDRNGTAVTIDQKNGVVKTAGAAEAAEAAEPEPEAPEPDLGPRRDRGNRIGPVRSGP